MSAVAAFTSAIADQKKDNKMKELINDENRTVVIVSHSSKTLTDLCDRVIWIEHGKMIKMGNTKEICDEYYKSQMK